MSSICAFSVFSVKLFRLPSHCVGAIISEYVTVYAAIYSSRVSGRPASCALLFFHQTKW